jgi:hypothetical protein
VSTLLRGRVTPLDWVNHHLENELATSEERMKILEMVQEGKISAEEAAHLIAALEDREPRAPVLPPAPAFSRNARWFRVKVTDTTSGKTRVNVRFPIGLIDAGMKMGARLSPEVQGMDPDQIKKLISSGEMGKIIDVFNEDDGEHFEIYVE